MIFHVATDAAAPPSDAEAPPEPERTMPEMSEATLTELAEFRAIGRAPEDVRRKIADLEKDNQKQRGEIDGLKEKVKAVPAEGAVVLTGDEATEYAAFKALDLKAADVATLRTENQTLAEKVAKTERETAFAKVAKLSGLSEDAVPAMLDMRSLDGAAWEFKPAKGKDKSGKDVDTEEVFVTLAGEGQKQQKFAELASTSPQLKGLPKAGDGDGAGNGITAPEMRGHAGGAPSVTGGIDALIAANQAAQKAGNPLMPAKAT